MVCIKFITTLTPSQGDGCLMLSLTFLTVFAAPDSLKEMWGLAAAAGYSGVKMTTRETQTPFNLKTDHSVRRRSLPSSHQNYGLPLNDPRDRASRNQHPNLRPFHSPPARQPSNPQRHSGNPPIRSFPLPIPRHLHPTTQHQARWPQS
jgi:hypothetical protein